MDVNVLLLHFSISNTSLFLVYIVAIHSNILDNINSQLYDTLVTASLISLSFTSTTLQTFNWLLKYVVRTLRG
jgi:hypothetical protein